MSYKFEIEKIKMPEDADRRKKLTKADKEYIVHLRVSSGLSTYKLAERFGVSRRTIQFILDPEKRKENLKRREERGGWRQYYDKEKNTRTVREHRRYKQKTLKARGLV